MINFRGKIPYTEYESVDLLKVKSSIAGKTKADIRKSPKIKTGSVEISRFRLSVAIAKSLYVKAADKKIKRQLAYSYFIQLPLILTSIRDCIYIDYDNMNLFRDFSKSCRDGEIAQGISYILVKDVLGAAVVEDFKYYCYKRKGFTSKCTNVTPDYVFTKRDGSVGILEAKGLMNANPTHSMTYGMDQCNNGERYMKTNGITVSNKYVSAITFATSKNKYRSTAIYFSDPPSDTTNQSLTPEYIQGSTYREYAKFMCMAGDDVLEDMVQQDGLRPEIKLDDYRKYFKRIYQNKQNHKSYKVDDEKKSTYKMISVVHKTYTPIFDNAVYEVEFGITKQAIKHVSEEFDTFYHTDSVYGTFEQGKGEFEIFPDGTYMSILRK